MYVSKKCRRRSSSDVGPMGLELESLNRRVKALKEQREKHRCQMPNTTKSEIALVQYA